MGVMRLFAAILVPPDVLDEVMDVVRATAPVEPEVEPKKGLFRRFSGPARAVEPTQVTSVNRELDLADPETMYIPITNFGNVTLSDSVRLAGALRRDVAGWPRARVHFTGGTALEFKGDESVWAKLDGDVETLMSIGRGVPQTVQQLGFFVDRRVFRPWLSVGTITEQTTAPYLQSVVDALEAFRGREWTVEHVSLMERPAEAESTETFFVKEQLPLGGS
jgi:2'-5' RNA ligase